MGTGLTVGMSWASSWLATPSSGERQTLAFWHNGHYFIASQRTTAFHNAYSGQVVAVSESPSMSEPFSAMPPPTLWASIFRDRSLYNKMNVEAAFIDIRGIPMRCMSSAWVEGYDGSVRVLSGLSVARASSRNGQLILPLRVHYGPFVLNAAIWGGVWWVICFCVRSCLVQRRLVRGLCRHCGYPCTRGPCSECGHGSP
jgi:hypothetical protein